MTFRDRIAHLLRLQLTQAAVSGATAFAHGVIGALVNVRTLLDVEIGREVVHAQEAIRDEHVKSCPMCLAEAEKRKAFDAMMGGGRAAAALPAEGWAGRAELMSRAAAVLAVLLLPARALADGVAGEAPDHTGIVLAIVIIAAFACATGVSIGRKLERRAWARFATRVQSGRYDA